MAYTLQQNYELSDSRAQSYGTRWNGTTFTANSAYTISRVSLLCYRDGDPGTVTISLYGTTSSKPSGDVLATMTMTGTDLPNGSDAVAWVTFDFITPYLLANGVEYAIVASCTGGSSSNDFNWRYKVTGSYANGNFCLSTDSGSNWGAYASDCDFRTYSGDTTSYVDMAFTDTVTFSEVLSLGRIIPIGFTNTVTFSESVTISLGPLSGTKAEKYTRRLVAFGNDTAYYETI